MKKTFFIAFATSILASQLFLACSKEEVVPEIDLKKAKSASVSEKQDSEEPALQPIEALATSSKSKKEKLSSTTKPILSASTNAVEQGSSGSYVIQISIQPSKNNANAIDEKLSSNNIEAYIADVENPGELEGTYYRVRIGYYESIESAQNFGKQTLERLGYAWWVDNKGNDHIGNSESDYEESYSAPMEEEEEVVEAPAPAPQAAPAPTPAPAPAPQAAPAPAPQVVPSAPAPQVAPPAPAPQVPPPAPAPQVAPPAPAAPAHQKEEELIDDWE